MKIANRFRNYSDEKFIIFLSLVTFFGKLPFLILSDAVFYAVGLGYLVEALEYAQVPEVTTIDFFLGTFVAPVVETLIGQALPIWFVSKITDKKTVKLGFSALVFMAMHYPSVTFFAGAFLVGWVLSWAWIEKRKESFGEAFWVTTSIHALHNLYAFIVTWLFAIGPGT